MAVAALYADTSDGAYPGKLYAVNAAVTLPPTSVNNVVTNILSTTTPALGLPPAQQSDATRG